MIKLKKNLLNENDYEFSNGHLPYYSIIHILDGFLISNDYKLCDGSNITLNNGIIFTTPNLSNDIFLCGSNNERYSGNNGQHIHNIDEKNIYGNTGNNSNTTFENHKHTIYNVSYSSNGIDYRFGEPDHSWRGNKDSGYNHHDYFTLNLKTLSHGHTAAVSKTMTKGSNSFNADSFTDSNMPQYVKLKSYIRLPI